MPFSCSVPIGDSFNPEVLNRLDFASEGTFLAVTTGRPLLLEATTDAAKYPTFQGQPPKHDDLAPKVNSAEAEKCCFILTQEAARMELPPAPSLRVLLRYLERSRAKPPPPSSLVNQMPRICA